MAFKLTPPFPIDNTPIYQVDMEDGVLGKANNNGTINPNILPIPSHNSGDINIFFIIYIFIIERNISSQNFIFGKRITMFLF